MSKSKNARKPTGEKKSKKAAETSPAKKPRAKKVARDAEQVQQQEPATSAPPAPEKVVGEELGARYVLDCLRFALDAAPKAKESPALAFVLVDDDRLVATDDYRHHTVWLGAKVAPAPVKITRASAEALAAVLAGEMKAGEATESSVALRWSGLVVEIGRAGETHEITLDRFEAGPAPEYLRLAIPEMRAHVMLGALAPEVMGWKGGGVVDVFTAADERQLCLQASLGETPCARQILSARGASLGIRQPTLPGVSTAPQPATVVTPTATGGPTMPEGAPQLAAAVAWVEVRCPEAGAWAELGEGQRAPLWPYRVDGADVVWGPYPPGTPRLMMLERQLRAMKCDPRLVDAPAPVEVRAGLTAGDGTPEPRQLGAGDVTDADVIEGDDGEAV